MTTLHVRRRLATDPHPGSGTINDGDDDNPGSAEMLARCLVAAALALVASPHAFARSSSVKAQSLFDEGRALTGQAVRRAHRDLGRWLVVCARRGRGVPMGWRRLAIV